MLDEVAAPLNTDSFAEMLSGPSDNEQPETDSQSAETEQEAEQETAEEGNEEAPEGEETEADEKQDEQPDEDSTEAFLELEIDGEKVKVSKEEAKNGYMRQRDYTQSKQNFAVEKQAAQQHIMKQFGEVQQMSQEIGQLTNIDAALQQYNNVDWQALRESDPLSYGIHKAEFNDMRIQRDGVVAAIGQKQASFGAMQAEEFAAKTAEAQAYLAKEIPDFGKEHIAAMKEHGTKLGFKAEELATVTDGRMMQALWEASQYRALKAKTSQAVKTVAALPTKAAKAAPVAKPAQQKNLENQTRRLGQTGSVKDFAALLGMAN